MQHLADPVDSEPALELVLVPEPGLAQLELVLVAPLEPSCSSVLVRHSLWLVFEHSEVVVEPLVGVAAGFVEVPYSPAVLEDLVLGVQLELVLVLSEGRTTQAVMVALPEVRPVEEVVTFALVEERVMAVLYADFPSRSGVG